MVRVRNLTAHFPTLPLVLLCISWLAVLTVCVAQLGWPQQLETYGLYSFVLGIVLLGLPHGALDHLVPIRMGFAWAKTPQGIGLFLLAYILVAGLYFGLWLLSPLLAFVGFLLATVGHWGQGDVRFLEIFLHRKRPNRLGTLISVLLRGSLPIVLPLLAFPQTAEGLYYHAAKGLGIPAVALNLAAPEISGPLMAYMALLFGAYLVNAIQAAQNRLFLWIDLLELVLLTLLFCTVPAYMSVGIYFIAWHSLRHLARLILLRPDHAQMLQTGQWVRPVARLTLDLVPITLCAIVLLVGLYLWKATFTTGLETFVALYLVLISALTKPHLLVVALMDYAPHKEAL